MAALLPIIVFDGVEFWFRSADDSEEAPSFAARMDGGEDRFVNDDGGPGDEGPDQDGFDRKVAVCFEKDAHHLVRHIGPPAVRNPKRSFPELADPKNEKPGEGEGTPIDESESDAGAEEAGDDAADEEKEEITRKGAAGLAWDRTADEPCDEEKDSADSEPKSEGLFPAAEHARRALGVIDFIGVKEDFVRPNIGEKHRDETEDVEDEFLKRQGWFPTGAEETTPATAQIVTGNENPERCVEVRKFQEEASENDVENEAKRDKQDESVQESATLLGRARAARDPEAEDGARDNKEGEAESVSKRAGLELEVYRLLADADSKHRDCAGNREHGHQGSDGQEVLPFASEREHKFCRESRRVLG